MFKYTTYNSDIYIYGVSTLETKTRRRLMYTHNEYLALSSRNVCIFNFVTRDSLIERNGISSAL